MLREREREEGRPSYLAIGRGERASARISTGFMVLLRRWRRQRWRRRKRRLTTTRARCRGDVASLLQGRRDILRPPPQWHGRSPQETITMKPVVDPFARRVAPDQRESSGETPRFYTRFSPIQEAKTVFSSSLGEVDLFGRCSQTH
jgi:hypothetical protein